jgi:hypothetical protein
MTKYLVVAGAMTLLAGVAQAQATNQCGSTAPLTPTTAASNAAHDVCVQAQDLFQFMAPQLGVALTGGNATLGQGGTMGGLGHFSIGVRGNVFNGDLPKVDKFPSPRPDQNQPSQQLPSEKQILGLPVVDAALGIFKGIPLPMTNILGVDALVSATYVPTLGDSNSNVQIKPQTSIKWGYGARIGILQESLLIPGVSVTYIKRDVPTTDITGRSTNATIQISNADVRTTAWRVVASKSLVLFGIAAGVGQDKYEQRATLGGTATVSTVLGNQTASFNPVTFSQDLTRTNAFLDLSLNLPIFKLVIEGGQVSGGSVPTFNSFSSGKADDSRVYGSAGLRFAW